MDGERLIVLVQGHECLCNLQHKDYDNNLVKDDSRKDIAAELMHKIRNLAERHGRGTAWYV
jgi:hypothetical protein